MVWAIGQSNLGVSSLSSRNSVDKSAFLGFPARRDDDVHYLQDLTYKTWQSLEPTVGSPKKCALLLIAHFYPLAKFIYASILQQNHEFFEVRQRSVLFQDTV
jgi:hypothetical protein